MYKVSIDDLKKFRKLHDHYPQGNVDIDLFWSAVAERLKDGDPPERLVEVCQKLITRIKNHPETGEAPHDLVSLDYVELERTILPVIWSVFPTEFANAAEEFLLKSKSKV